MNKKIFFMAAVSVFMMNDASAIKFLGQEISDNHKKTEHSITYSHPGDKNKITTKVTYTQSAFVAKIPDHIPLQIEGTKMSGNEIEDFSPQFGEDDHYSMAVFSDGKTTCTARHGNRGAKGEKRIGELDIQKPAGVQQPTQPAPQAAPK